MRRKILLVDDNASNLAVGKKALQDTYQVVTLPSGEKMLEALKAIRPDLILLDIEMPGLNGYQTIKLLKQNPEYAGIPVIFLTAKSDPESELDGLSLGAVDYITKPFSPPLLKKRIELHLLLEDQQAKLMHYNDNLQKMVDEKTEKILKLQDAILTAVAELVECRDGTTGGHIGRTQRYLEALLYKMRERNVYAEQSSGWDLRLLIRSAQLHDVGKISIPDSILKKADTLTDAEFEIMKSHTTLGSDALIRITENAEESEFLRQAAILARSHHEWWNGLGYPEGLSGEQIPLQGRLMAIADVYDALTSQRPYKQAFTHERAVEIIVSGSGGQFDPVLVELFKQASNEFQEIARSNSSC